VYFVDQWSIKHRHQNVVVGLCQCLWMLEGEQMRWEHSKNAKADASVM